MSVCFFFAQHNRVLQMEVNENDHFFIAGLEECMFDVIEENVYYVAPQ
jgi:hypothetical protein